LLKQYNIDHGFCRRRGGVSLPPFDSLNLASRWGDEPQRVAANLELLASRIGIQTSQLVCAAQESSDKIYEVQANDTVEKIRQTVADALIFALPKKNSVGALPFLCIRTADCLPALLYAPASAKYPAYIAGVHVGWQGARLRLLEKAIALLQSKGVDPRQLVIVLGPAIGPCCLRLGGEIKESFETKFAKHPALIYRQEDPSALYLDLWEHSRSLALDQAVESKNIEILRYCTSCRRDWFYSYRRDGKLTGQHLSFIGFRG
jgi:YfiH family protein